MNCGNDNYDSENCFIEATFGNLASSNESIDVLVNCRDVSSNSSTSSYRNNQFSRYDMIVWNGCYAMRNLQFFGLQKIQQINRKQVKYLKIEKFKTTSIEIGTFDGFIQLEILEIESNSIQNLSASCFRGLENSLLKLRLISNNLKWMGEQVLSNLPKLNTLQIQEGGLLIANRQFSNRNDENRDFVVVEGDMNKTVVEHVSIEIYHIEMDLIEHLFHHVRNLSISLTSSNDFEVGRDYCVLTRFNGYEKAWLVENLKLENHRCGFVMENVKTLRTLELKKVILNPILFQNDFKLKNLQNLNAIVLNDNELTEITQSIFEGTFEEVEELDFSHNRLTEIDLSILKLFPKLSHIDLSYNSIHQILNIHNIHNSRIQLIVVDYNRFDCEWLVYHSMKSFAFTKRFETLNVNGLECTTSTRNNNIVPLCMNNENVYQAQLSALYEENFITTPKIFISIICGSILLGFIITYISIFLYQHRRRWLKQEPFYHMLRDSLVQPFTVARETLARDFKGVLWRKLPPTNYEQPISDSNLNVVTHDGNSNGDVDVGNIYEEIPALRS